MKITFDWLKDHLNIGLKEEKLLEQLTNIGLEVENVENLSTGIELFKVKKRDYDWGFGHLDFENTTLTANFYVRNYGLIPLGRITI